MSGQEVSLCTDCEKDYPQATCHRGNAEFARGYDQGVAEVMSELERSDITLYRELCHKYPAWRR